MPTAVLFNGPVVDVKADIESSLTSPLKVTRTRGILIFSVLSPVPEW